MDNERKKLLKQALTSILKPVARLLMYNSISHREFSDLSKFSFFEAGQEIAKDSADQVTDSNLSLITGLHRKDISLFRKKFLELKNKTLQNGKSSSSTLVAEWLTNAIYIDKEDKPLKLKYLGDQPSFSSLAKSVSSDIRPKAYLEELQRLGIVEYDGEFVSLRAAAFVPSGDLSEKIKFFTRNIRDHLCASTNNIIYEKESPHFDRSAFYTDLSEDDVVKIKEFVEKEGMVLLKKAYHLAKELSKKNESNAKQRVTIGLYMYNEKNNEDFSK